MPATDVNGGSFSGGGASGSWSTGDNSTRKNIKIWLATDQSKAGMMVTEKAAFVIGSKTNFIAVGSTGIHLSGQGISFGTASENQRHGGLFVKMNDLTQMIPTTLITPMPSQIPWPPLGLVTGLLLDLPFFMAMVKDS